MSFQPFALRFHTRREAELVAEALRRLKCAEPADAFSVKEMRELLDTELGNPPG